jgi:hypothetical protein
MSFAEQEKETAMASRTLISILCVVVATNAALGTASDPSWDNLVAELRSSDCLTASLIGVFPLPSGSFELYKTVIRCGDSRKFAELVKDKHPVVRCVGLLATAQTAGKEAIPILRKHLSERATVRYQAHDLISSMIVGEFALLLLDDVNCLVLGEEHTRAPLLSDSEWSSFRVEVLADDSATAVFELVREMRPIKLILDLSTLRQWTSSLKDYQVIKAIGRLKPSDDQKKFLVDCLHTAGLDSAAKLAAASALTLRADEASFRAIRMEQDALNRIDEQRWGDRFIETLNTRRAHERNMESVRGRKWQEQESIKDKVLLAFTCSHPLALDDFLDNPAPVVIRDHADMRDALANSLITISRNIEGYNQPWNTYSNAAYKLDAFVQSDRRSKRNGLLTDNECAEIEKNIRRFIEVSSQQSQP